MKAARLGGVLAALKMGIFEVLHEKDSGAVPMETERVARLRVMGSDGWYESDLGRDCRPRTTLIFYT